MYTLSDTEYQKIIKSISGSTQSLSLDAPQTPKEQGLMGDFVDSVQMGAWRGASDLARGVNSLFNAKWLDDAADWAAKNADENMQTMSQKMRDALGQSAFDGVDEQSGEGKGILNAYWWAGNFGAMLGSNLDAAFTLGAGKLATTALKQGGKFLSKQAAEEVGKAAVQEAAKRGIPSKYANAIGYSAIMGAMGAGNRDNQVRDELAQYSDEQLAEIQGFRDEYFALRGDSQYQNQDDNTVFDLAKQNFISKASREAALNPTAIAADFVAGGLGGFAGGWGGILNPAKTLKGGLAKGAVIEAATEGMQGAAEQYAINTAAQAHYDPNRETTDGMERAVVDGMVLGGAFGGVFGAVDAKRNQSAMQKEKRRIVEAISTGNPEIDAQLKQSADAANQFANDLDEIIANGQRIRAKTALAAKEVRARHIMQELEAQKPETVFANEIEKIRADGLNDTEIDQFIAAKVNALQQHQQELAANPFQMTDNYDESLQKRKAYQDDVAKTEQDLAYWLAFQRFRNAAPLTQTEAELQKSANTAPAAARNVLQGATDSVDIGENNYQPVQYEVMEVADLAPTQQKAGNQLRDRDRAASQAQVTKIARNLDPRKLAESPTMEMGAPLLAQDGKTVIAGNGRSMAIRQAYQEGNADGYRQYLQTNAAKFGLDSNQIAAMQNPVLVHRLNAAVNIKQTAINSNEQGGMRMSNLEQAKVDAGRLPNMAGFELGENGELNTAGNQHFISQFIRNQPETLRNELLDSRGNLSQTGVQRLRNAMLYHAYGDTDTLARAVESTDQGARNILNALTRIAPKVAQVKQDIAAGTLGDVDISGAIVAAVEKYNQLKSQNQDVGEYLQQQDFVSELAPEAKAVLRIFNENSRSAKRIGDILQSYYHTAEAQANTAQSSMFSDTPLDKVGTLEQAKKADLDALYSRSPIKSVEANIARGRKAMHTAIVERRTVHRAMFNHDLDGWVDFEWGDDGLTKPFNNKGEPVGKGISHIIEARMRKDSMSYAQATKMLTQDIVETVAKGNITQNQYNEKAKENRIHIEHNGYRAVLIKKKGNNSWLLTGFELHSDGGQRVGFDTTEPTHSKPTLTRQGMGAPDYLPTDVNSAGGVDTEITTRTKPTLTRQGVGAIGTDNVQQSSPQINSFDPEITQAKALLRKIIGNKLTEQIHFTLSQDIHDNDPSRQQGKRSSEGFFEKGKLTLVLDNIGESATLSRQERLVWVAWHELAHRGVNLNFKGRYATIMQQADKNSVIHTIANQIQQERQGTGDLSEHHREIAVEEAIAELYSAYETGNYNELRERYGATIKPLHEKNFKAWFAQLATQLREFFGKLVGREKAETFSDAQVFELLKDVKRGIEMEGQNQQTAGVNASEIRHSFAGEKAKTANHSSLEQAKRAVQSGQNPETVRQQTGWFTGADGKWRFEIDDSQARFIGKAALEQLAKQDPYGMAMLPVSDVFNHPSLFAAYPDLQDIQVTYESTEVAGGDLYYGANFDPDSRTIMLGNGLTEQQIASAIVHELQHAVQTEEGFASGGSPDEFKQAENPTKAYESLAGEVEARNVQSRQHFTAEERRNRSPESTEDVARAEQIVRFNNGRSDFALREDPSSEFAKAVDEIFNSSEARFDNDRWIELGTTPEPLIQAGIDDKVMKINFAKIGKIKNEHPEMTADLLKQIPAQLNNPVAVFKNTKGKPNSYVVLTELVVKGNERVIAALHADEEQNGLVFHKLASAYGKDGTRAYLENMIEKSDVRFVDKQKAGRINSKLQLLAEDTLNLLFDKASVVKDDNVVNDENSDNNLSETAYNQAKAAGKTELTFQQWKQVRSPEFKAWFGDWENDPKNASKVINPKTGEPLVVYHGSKRGEDFNVFNPKLIGERFGLGTHGKGFYFSNSLGTAIYYGERPLKEVFLNIRNPFNREDDISEVNNRFTSSIKRKGYDGVFGKDTLPWANKNDMELVVFNPNQIKSATDNNGQFSSENDDIRYSRTAAFDKLGLGKNPSWTEQVKTATNAVKEKPVSEWKTYFTHLGRKANAAIFDALAPIKYFEDRAGIRDHAKSGYTAARLAAGSASTTEAAMLHGLPEFDKDGFVQRKQGTGEKEALVGIMESLGGDMNAFLGWVAGNRAEQLMREGREHNLSIDDIAELKALNKGKEAKFEAARQKLQAWNTAILDLAERSGLLSKAERAKFGGNEFYIPFYRENDDGDPIAPYRKSGLANQNSGIRKLKGSDKATSDLLGNLISNAAKVIDASVKNMAMTKTVTNLADTGVISIIDNPNKMDYMGVNKATKDGGKTIVRMNGKEYLIEIHDLSLFNALTNIDQKPLDYPMRKIFSGAKRILTATVTSMPDFIVRNFLRDIVQAATTDRNSMKLGIDSLKGLKKAYQKDGVAVDLAFTGATFGHGFIDAGDPKAAAAKIRKYLRKKGYAPNEIEGYMKGVIWSKDQLEKVFDKYFAFNSAVENANRIAVYESALANGKSRAQAALEAKDLMDFSMHGNAKVIRLLGDVLPFFNARLQGLSQLGRALKDNPRKVAVRGAYIAAASVTLAAINAGNPHYDELPEEEKDNYWHLFVGEEHFRIPKPFEIGVIFGTMPERLFRTTAGFDSTGRFAEQVGAAIMNTFALNPTPQLVKPVAELYMNRNMFTGRPIESMSDQRLLPEARYDERTSLIARGLGSITGTSPKQIEHLVRGYFGTLGMYVLGMADTVVRTGGDYGEQPAKYWNEYPVLSAVFGGDVNVPPRYTSYMNDFYHYVNQVSEIAATAKSYEEEGKNAQAAQLLHDNAKLLAYKPKLNAVQKEIRQMKAQMDLIMQDRTKDADWKRERLDRLVRNRNALIQSVVERMRTEDF